MDIPLIEQVKLQAQVLVPLVKALQAELGEERANAVVIKRSPDAFEVNVTGCRYAKFYKEIGAPELEFLLTCSSDFSLTEGFGAGVKLTRTQTIMQGASHCDFRYALRQSDKDAQ